MLKPLLQAMIIQFYLTKNVNVLRTWGFMREGLSRGKVNKSISPKGYLIVLLTDFIGISYFLLHTF